MNGWEICWLIIKIWLFLGFTGSLLMVLGDYYKTKKEKIVINISILDIIVFGIFYILGCVVCSLMGIIALIKGIHVISHYISFKLFHNIKTFSTKQRFTIDLSDKPKRPSKRQILEDELVSDLLN